MPEFDAIVWLIKDSADYFKLTTSAIDPDKWNHPIDLGSFPVSAYLSDADL